MWDGITYPFHNFSGAAVEGLQWKSNITPHFTRYVITDTYWGGRQSMFVKGVQVHVLWDTLDVPYSYMYMSKCIFVQGSESLWYIYGTLGNPYETSLSTGTHSHAIMRFGLDRMDAIRGKHATVPMIATLYFSTTILRPILYIYIYIYIMKINIDN